MYSLTSAMQYNIYSKATDMRNSFDGLSGIVRNELGKNPLSGDVFIFLNRRRNLIKILRWETGGFTLYYKRLEKGSFELPEIEKGAKTVEISWTILMLITEGISIRHIKRKHRYVSASEKAGAKFDTSVVNNPYEINRCENKSANAGFGE